MKAETQPMSARPPPWRDNLRIEGESVDADEKNTDGNKGPDEVFDRGESMLWLAASYLEAQGYKPRRSDEFLCPISKVWNVLEPLKTQYQKRYANDADELERYGFCKKSKARVTKHDDQSKEHLYEGANLDQSCDPETTFETHCEATGHFPPVRHYRNVDDCRVHTCGPHGTCVDGVNSDSCYCDPGFQGDGRSTE